jgi:uroporphyrinogen decarboxylase
MPKKGMTSRERVMAALNHQEPDRIPRDFGGTFTTSIHVGAYSRLMRLLGMDPGPDRIDNYQVCTAALDPRLVDWVRSDCVA